MATLRMSWRVAILRRFSRSEWTACAYVSATRTLPGWTRHGLTRWSVALTGTASAGYCAEAVSGVDRPSCLPFPTCPSSLSFPLRALLQKAHVLVEGGLEPEGADVGEVQAGGHELGALIQGNGSGGGPDPGVGLANQGTRLVLVQRRDGLVEELVDLVGADPGVVLLDGEGAVRCRDRLRVDRAGVRGGEGRGGPGVQRQVVLAEAMWSLK